MILGGTLFTIVILLWPIFMVLSKTTGNLHDQLLSIADNPSMYMINFVIASFIAPATSFIMITLALFIKTKKETPILNIFGVFLLAPYVTLVSIAYASQYTLLQSYLNDANFSEASLWFFENSNSVSYFLNQLGYTFFALSALLIGFKLLFEQGIPKAVGVLLWLSGFLSIVAFIGLTMKNEILNLSTIISGLTMVPIGIIVIIWGVKLARHKEISYE